MNPLLIIVIEIWLYGVNGMFLFHAIPKQLEIYAKLLKTFTLLSLAGFCEVLTIFINVKCHISKWQIDLIKF